LDLAEFPVQFCWRLLSFFVGSACVLAWECSAQLLADILKTGCLLADSRWPSGTLHTKHVLLVAMLAQVQTDECTCFYVLPLSPLGSPPSIMQVRISMNSFISFLDFGGVIFGSRSLQPSRWRFAEGLALPGFRITIRILMMLAMIRGSCLGYYPPDCFGSSSSDFRILVRIPITFDRVGITHTIQ